MDAHDIDRRLVWSHHDSPLGKWSELVCRPHPRLADHVAALWYGEGRVDYRRDRILPRGCAHLLIELGTPQVLVSPTGETRCLRGGWLSGQHATFLDTEAPHGVAVLGVAFSPHGAYALTGCSQTELAGRVVPVGDVYGPEVERLRQRLLETPDPGTRLARVESWLLRRLDRGREVHPATPWAVRRIAAAAGCVKVEDLASASGYSRKYLSNVLRREVGLGPKVLARLHRFQAALAGLSVSPAPSWSALAADCGYYDQSHLIRDFKVFTGCSPEELLTRETADPMTLIVE